MALAEGLTSFGISLGAGVVIEGRKLFISSEVQTQIKKAFEESLKEFCINPDIREKERRNIKGILETAAKQPNTDLRNENISGNYSIFFSIFESKIVKHDAAFRYLKEVRDEKRYLEILSEVKSAIETLKGEVKNNSSTELELEYNRQIEQYKSNLEALKPKTAFSNLTALEKSFNNYNFAPSDIMKSSLETLKGRCLEYMPENKNEWQKAYIRAYKLNEKSRENLENACYAYFRIDEFSEAEKLADSVLQLDEYNSKAWLVKSLIQDNVKLCDILSRVPKVVIDDWFFKALIQARSIEKGTYLDLAEAFSSYNIILDFTEFNGLPTTFENLREIGYLVNCAGSKIMMQYINFNEPIKLSIDLLTPIYEIQNSYLQAVDNSEIEGKHATLKFLNAYVQFLIEKDKDCVYRMKEFYSQISTEQPYNTLVLANSLQLIGDINDAIKIISESKEHTSELLALQLICYSKQEDIDNFILTAKEFLKGVTDVTYHLVHMYSIPELLNDFDLNSRISINEYIEGKSFSNDEEKNLLIETLKVFKGENDANSVNKLDCIFASNNISEDYMLSALANSYLLLKEFKKSIEVYNKYLDTSIESQDLLRYILALHASRTNNTELLAALKIWRENLSFNPKILELEIELKRQLFAWDEILLICNQYIDKDDSNEFIISNYAIALNETDNISKDQFIELFKLAEKIEYNSYQNARVTAEVLMQNECLIEGLELYYKHAINESNAQARTDYFMACIKSPEGTLKDFETIVEGHFVKYANESATSIVEVSDKNIKFKQLIGKKVGDEITFSSDLSKSNKKVKIQRIMNKYLALHNKILEEVDKKDPFSQIAMESFNVEKYIKEGNLLDFIEELAGNKNYVPDELINQYYSGKLSFTELVSIEYSNHFIKAYYNLEFDKKGVTQCSPTSYPDINLLEYDNYILDFTSLLRLFELSKNKGLKCTKRFTLTTSTKSMVKAFSKDFIGHSGNQYNLNSIFYEELLAWLDLNCDLKMSVSKLDIIHAIPKEARANPVQGLLLDTVTLSQDLPKSLLISDDSMMLKFYPINSGRIIGTSTFYLKAILQGIIEK